MCITIRPAAVPDVERIARLHVEAWRWAYSELLPPSFLASLDVAKRADGWRGVLVAVPRRTQLLVCEAEGSELLGFIASGPARDEDVERAGEVYALYLAEQAVGRGHGARLLAAAEASLLEGKLARAILWVLHGNDRARRFYERHGWRVDGSTKEETFADHPLLEVRMRKELVPPRAHGR